MTRYIVRGKALLNVYYDTRFDIVNTGRQSVLKEAGIIVEPTDPETDTTDSDESNNMINKKSEETNSNPDEKTATDSNESTGEINSESATGSTTEEGASE